MVSQERPIFIGRGIYSVSEAARLTQVSAPTVRSWVKGRHRHGRAAGCGPLLRADYRSTDALSFLDLIEVLVAGHLKNAGVPMVSIRRAHAAIAEQLSTDHPFGHCDLCTDGTRIFLLAAKQGDEPELIEVIAKQRFFHGVMEPYLSRVEYDPVSRLARAWRVSEGVILDPAIQLGKPTVEGTGIPVTVLAAAFVANHRNVNLTASWYGVSPEDVHRAASFAAA